MKFPTYEEMGQEVANRVLDEYEYKGKTLRQWIEIISATELGTNLAEVGTDLISRQQAIDALCGYLVGKRCPDDGTLTCRLIENEVIKQLPPIQPEITHEQAVEYLQSTGWMQEHDRQMMLDGVHRLTAQPEPPEECERCMMEHTAVWSLCRTSSS